MSPNFTLPNSAKFGFRRSLLQHGYAARATLLIGLIVPLLALSQQVISPSQVTPPSLRVPSAPPDWPAFVPEESAVAEAEHTQSMTVEVGAITVLDGFAVLAGHTSDLLEPYQHRRISSDDMFALAGAIEHAYAARGYVLVRVVVPPQRVADGKTLFLQVVDGFIQDVDVSGVPWSVRRVVARRMRMLVGRRHLKLATIERRILIAGDVPGLRLSSTLVPGAEDGATRLILSGRYEAVSGSVGADDRLERSIGPWETNGSVALNSLLGQGEQFYAYGSGSRPPGVFRDSTPLQVVGGGSVIPVGAAGLTLNPEYTHSVTRNPAQAGAPATQGTFQRISLRSSIPLLWSRRHVLKIDVDVEDIAQTLKAPLFSSDVNEDHYRALRAGFNLDQLWDGGRRLATAAELSHGLGGRDAADAAASGVPLSRLGAGPDFNKLTGSARFALPLPRGLRLDAIALGQATFGHPMLRSEQFSLDGADALSAFTPGALSVDQGATLRVELSRPVAVAIHGLAGTVSPYVVAADGSGAVVDPTAAETRSVQASTVGGGARAAFALPGGANTLEFAVELAQQRAHTDELRTEWHGNLIASIRF